MYKGFDEKQGIDIAWSKIEASNNHLSQEQMKKIVEEISYGLGLDHPHVIRVRARPARGVGCRQGRGGAPRQAGCSSAAAGRLEH